MQVTAQLSGWRTSAGLLLREPATASVDYTPALAKYVCTRLAFPSLLPPSTSFPLLCVPAPTYLCQQDASDNKFHIPPLRIAHRRLTSTCLLEQMHECCGVCRYGLQRISPLLSNVVAVHEGGKVQMAFTPQDMTLPAEKTSVQIEPMKLVVGRGDFVSKIVDLLGLKDGSE